GHYSSLMFADLMMGHHLSISALCSAPSASGVCCSRGGISSPKSLSRSRTIGSAIASMAAALSLVMTSGGVPLGAQSALQIDIPSCGAPASATVGMLGAEVRRVLAVTA